VGWERELGVVGSRVRREVEVEDGWGVRAGRVRSCGACLEDNVSR
jgi:hypothetical protein